MQLSRRALQILIVLADRAGAVVETRELMELVWPERAVVEGSVRVQIAALRRMLDAHEPGMQYIQNVMGHGYRFVGIVMRESCQNRSAGNCEHLPQTATHAAAPTQLIGREQEISELATGLTRPGLTTLLGPAGVGKTAVVAAAVDHWCRTHSKEARWVDLGPTQDPERARRAITAALPICSARIESAAGRPHRFAETQALLVLDGCEGVTAAVREIVGEILLDANDVCVVATSCEPLGMRRERVYRLAPLELPPLPVKPSEGLQYPAVQLFVQRATGTQVAHGLDEADIGLVIEICRRLDGLPFAIELAAAQVDVFGIAGTAACLRDGLEVLVGGQRTAGPQQRSLRARLDWSYSMLSPVEQAALGSLTRLVDSFNAAAASQAMEGQARGPSEAGALLARLAEISLLETSGSGNHVSYRLLNTTRAYAREKLSATVNTHNPGADLEPRSTPETAAHSSRNRGYSNDRSVAELSRVPVNRTPFSADMSPSAHHSRA